MSNKLFLAHYGTPHEGATPHSGRYEWGSGEAFHFLQRYRNHPFYPKKIIQKR